MRAALCLSFLSLSILSVGCGKSAPQAPPTTPSTTPSSTPVAEPEAHGHSHDRGKMLIADAGPHHALLTAHLSPEGNELDIFFETPVDTNPQPVALPVASFEAQATVGDGEAQTLTFEPAPAEERPAGEPADRCSHFVAKAPWMKPDQPLYVVARITLDGNEVSIRWKDFLPSRYAHHVE